METSLQTLDNPIDKQNKEVFSSNRLHPASNTCGSQEPGSDVNKALQGLSHCLWHHKGSAVEEGDIQPTYTSNNRYRCDPAANTVKYGSPIHHL